MPETIDVLREKILAQNPTSEQCEAIFSDDLEFLLRAAPGSGKTWTSCRRFIWRGANWPYSMGGLALLSFTNVAVKEFKEATSKVGRRDLLMDPNYVGTFDSFVERFIISPFGHLLVKKGKKRPKLFRIPRPSDWGNKSFEIWIDRFNRKVSKKAWEIIPYPEGNKYKFKISDKYGEEILPFRDSLKAIQSFILSGFYTHEQRVYWACQILFERPHIAELLAKRFPEIIVDEAQDTNSWLLILLNYLRLKGAKITLVGDPDQCIYEFSMADATSLSNLKDKWSIPEKPLSRSFRCNNQIAKCVCSIGGNANFSGYGDGESSAHKAYIIKEPVNTPFESVDNFQKIISDSGLNFNSSAILCRAHNQLDSLRGEINYYDLEGKTRKLAKASFLRDSKYDYHNAYQIVESVLREITSDDELWEFLEEHPESPEATSTSILIWRFIKKKNRLPSVSNISTEWIEIVKNNLSKLIDEIGLENPGKLGRHINKRGLSVEQQELPLFKPNQNFPPIRQETIHQVKGESIDAVMVVGSTRFWNSVINAINKNESTEDRRLAYVAMSRARQLLVVSLPENHFDNYIGDWQNWGFEVL